MTAAPATVPAATVARVLGELLERSDERDTALALRLDAWRDGYTTAATDAYDAGYADGVASLKRAQHDAVRLTELDRDRWHVCCGPCRRGGHRPGCRDCQDRTRAAYGQPHPDDYPGQDGAA